MNKRGDYYPDTMSREARRLVSAAFDLRTLESYKPSCPKVREAYESLAEMSRRALRHQAMRFIAGPEQ